jgi:diaminohydroxyphosphoribosylaminopyrimidine deaminase/5-amino-6-(5-phosphoribosylamino)uracil reductase
MAMDDHEGLMRRVLELAGHGQWRSSPNPLTGALVVRDGQVVGEGHLNERGDHAEAVALDRAAHAGGSVGATLYTNLEPCCWTGVGKHTPPCAQRIIGEGVRRVVIATADPHPKVDGAGARMLREAGIDVVERVLEDEAALLNAVHFKFHRTGMPLVTLKIAQSTDGRIATAGGDSRWISDRDARVMTHELRAGHDAIMVGAGTALADDPELTVRLTPLLRDRQPLPVVIDSTLRLPAAARLMAGEREPLVFTTDRHDAGARAALERAGARVAVVGSTADGRVALDQVLAALAGAGVTSVLVEGGAVLYTELIRQRLFDKLVVVVAPIIIGAGTDAVGDLGNARLADALRLEHVSHRQINDQAIITGYRSLAATLGHAGSGPLPGAQPQEAGCSAVS